MGAMRRIILVVHNVRSTHNVGSLLRTADGMGVERVFLTGYTPFPLLEPDERLPHIAQKLDAQIHKTALGAEKLIPWTHATDIGPVVESLRQAGYMVCAVEQDVDAIALPDFRPPDKIALIVGREVEGIEREVLAATDDILEIPMYGRKESLNVVQAAAMALYHCRIS
jgi:tRNA G18 (ribose-2'-O)-methylase SpoU